MDPKEHGHLTLADLFKEIRGDEAARREAIIRECYDLNKKIGYGQIRESFFTDPEIVEDYPDPEKREQHLQEMWSQASEPHFQSFKEKTDGMSIYDLENYRDSLQLKMDITGEYQKLVDEKAKSAARDKDIER